MEGINPDFAPAIVARSPALDWALAGSAVSAPCLRWLVRLTKNSRVAFIGAWPMPSTTATVFAFQFDQDWHFAAEREVRKLDHRSSEYGRHSRVNRIAALLQNSQAGFDRQRMTTGDDAALAANDRAKRLRARCGWRSRSEQQAESD